MLSQLPEMFSSRSRTSLLLLLEAMTMPVCLSELSELSGNSLCATQSALSQLHRERWVRRARRGKETLYSLNRDHPAASTLSCIAKNLRMEAIRVRAERYSLKAQQALTFASESRRFLSKVRRLNSDA